MSRIIRVVKETFRKYPMLANSTVYGTMCVGAEFSQQIMTKRILVKYNCRYASKIMNSYKNYTFTLGLYNFHRIKLNHQNR